MLRTFFAAALLLSFALAGCAEPDDSDIQDVGGGTTTESPWTAGSPTGNGNATSNGTMSSTATTTYPA